jgi:hypothetical protein
MKMNTMKAGRWKTLITPPGKNEKQEILDDFFVNALVLDDGTNETVMISADTANVNNSVVKDILGNISSICGIPEDVVTAVSMAKKRKQPVKIGIGRGENSNHVFNRRLKHPDGKTIMNWIPPKYLQGCSSEGVTDP